MFAKVMVFGIFSALLATVTALDTSEVPPRPGPAQNATKCFTCYNPDTCLRPEAVVCDHSSADATRLALVQHFSNVSEATSPQFECLKLRYTLKKSVELAVSGCINVGLNPCNLQPKNATLAGASKTCAHCSKNLCNPAGTFSSSLVIVISAMFGWWLLKC